MSFTSCTASKLVFATKWVLTSSNSGTSLMLQKSSFDRWLARHHSKQKNNLVFRWFGFAHHITFVLDMPLQRNCTADRRDDRIWFNRVVRIHAELSLAWSMATDCCSLYPSWCRQMFSQTWRWRWGTRAQQHIIIYYILMSAVATDLADTVHSGRTGHSVVTTELSLKASAAPAIGRLLLHKSQKMFWTFGGMAFHTSL